MSYLRRRSNAFRYALQGLGTSLRREHHMRIHAVAAAGAVVAGIAMQIKAWEWFAVSCSIALVLICELLNTAIEKLCDLVTTEQHPEVKYIKDISAAAVMLACTLAVFTALLVFGGRLAAFAP